MAEYNPLNINKKFQIKKKFVSCLIVYFDICSF